MAVLEDVTEEAPAADAPQRAASGDGAGADAGEQSSRRPPRQPPMNDAPSAHKALTEYPDIVRRTVPWLLHPQRSGPPPPGEKWPRVGADGKIANQADALEVRAREGAKMLAALGAAPVKTLAETVASEEKAALLETAAKLVRTGAATDRFMAQGVFEPVCMLLLQGLPGWCKDREIALRSLDSGDPSHDVLNALAAAVMTLAQARRPMHEAMLGMLCASLQNVSVTCRMADDGSAARWMGSPAFRTVLDANCCDNPRMGVHIQHLVANALACPPAVRTVLARGKPAGDALVMAAVRAAVATKKGAEAGDTPPPARAHVIRLQRAAAAATAAGAAAEEEGEDADAAAAAAIAKLEPATAAGEQQQQGEQQGKQQDEQPSQEQRERLPPKEVQKLALQVLQASFNDIKAELDAALAQDAARKMKDLVVVIDLKDKRNSIHLLDEWRKHRGFPVGWFVRPGDPPAVDTPALESFLAHVERNVAQRKNDDELMLCVKDPSGGGLSMLRVTMTFKPPPPPAPAVMPAPPGIEGEADEEDFDFDVDKDFGGDEDAAFEHLVSSLQAPAVQEPATFLERVVEALWALLAMIAAALGVGQRAAGEAHPHSD